ncbi:MAG: twin-arginine translocase TatA/TatE family subunit [Blastocatellia bacterium]|nr:twin-arginine translocase TatA/TatE family subunit [Blastocatellia bacterium]
MDFSTSGILLIGLGWPEMLIIILIVVILFGARRIPEVAKGLGEGIRSFKTGLHGNERGELEEGKDNSPRATEEQEHKRQSA